ncbi:MAG: acyl-CoA thioesterase [Bacteriovoracaceae bacterium]
MHMLWRTLLIFLSKNSGEKVSFLDETEYTMRVLPTDLDLLMHVNNGVYFSFMDFGRWNMIFKNGAYDLAKKNGWYTVVAGETIRFKKSLKLWDKFTMKTKMVGHDDKYFFIEQRFLKNGEEMATGLVKVRFLKKAGGTISAPDVLKVFNVEERRVSELSNDWANLDAKYLY